MPVSRFPFPAASIYDLIEKQSRTAGNGTRRRLLKRYALPAIIAMSSSSLYNIIDSIFIGHGVGAMAISGLAIAMPLMNLMAASGRW